MDTKYSFKIYHTISELPINWNDLATSTIFLSKEYFEILEKSAPENMRCHFIGFFQEEILVGIAISQFLNLNKLQSFGERDKCIKSFVRNFIFKNFSSHVLFIGNNMLTGQNAYFFSKNIDTKITAQLLKNSSKEIKNKLKTEGTKVHLTTFKDFDNSDTQLLKSKGFEDYFQFSTQPNMVFKIQEKWKSEQDYIDALSKKYLNQYKRARKKAIGIDKRKMHLEDIIKHEETIYKLYLHVAKNAPFNTFFLVKNHFRVFKQVLKDKFLFYGYFIDEKLIGFNTLIKNGDAMDTYFLGYDDDIQREKMLYLNMLYDMIAYSINKGFKEVVFARTALEIKSSVGAKPREMFGFMKHSDALIDKNIAKIFSYLEPDIEWKERSPFK